MYSKDFTARQKVRFWHKADMPIALSEVCLWGQSGLAGNIGFSSVVDPCADIAFARPQSVDRHLTASRGLNVNDARSALHVHFA